MAWHETDRREKFSEELLESENDRLMDNVAAKVATLKHVAVDLRSEAKDQVNLLDKSGGVFEVASVLLNSSFKKVQGMRRTRLADCKYMCYVTLVMTVLLLIGYFMVSRVISR